MAEFGGTRSETSSSLSQNDSAVFASSLVEQVNKEDIHSMINIQRDILSRFEKTNEMLINFNILSTGRYEATVKEFSQHTKLLFDMKRDLDSIFKRIRTLKNRLATLHPEAYEACNSVYDVPSEEEENSDEDNHKPAQQSLRIPKSHFDILASKEESHSKDVKDDA